MKPFRFLVLAALALALAALAPERPTWDGGAVWDAAFVAEATGPPAPAVAVQPAAAAQAHDVATYYANTTSRHGPAPPLENENTGSAPTLDDTGKRATDYAGTRWHPMRC